MPGIRAQSAVQFAFGYYPLHGATLKGGQGHNQMEKASSQRGFKWIHGHLLKFQLLSEVFSTSTLKGLDAESKQAQS